MPLTKLELFDWLEENTLDLNCVDETDGDYHWEVIEHHEAKPKKRLIGAGRTVDDAIMCAYFRGLEVDD